MTRQVWEIADLFCGAGGTSTGARKAIRKMGGELKLVAVNHWQVAVDTHKLNHPDAEHIVQDVGTVDPEKAVPRGRLHLLLASPECRHYSNARGGKPVSDQGRMSPWAINNWLTRLYVERGVIENVPEFRNWGPICGLLDGHKAECTAIAGPDPEPHCGEEMGHESYFALIDQVKDKKLQRKLVKQGRKYGCPLPYDHAGECDFTQELPPQVCNRPVPSKKGTYFQAWVASLWTMGYDVQWKILNAADFGDATTRKRLFIQIRRDGKPIRWPEPTHAPPPLAGKPRLDGRVLLPYVAARKIIDWSDEGESIFERTTPLSENTRLRMARGLQRFGGPLAPLYIDLLGLPEAEAARYHRPETWSAEQQPFVFANRAHNVPTDVDTPIATITTATGGGSYLVQPQAEPFLVGQHSGSVPQSTDEPAPTIVNIARIRLFQPTAEPFIVNRNNNASLSTMDEPLPTATGRGAGYLATPGALVVPQHAGGIARSPDQPLPTITGSGHAVAQPMILPYHGQSQCYPVTDPLNTISTKDDYALVQPTLEPPEGMAVPYGPKAEARPVSEPLGTIPTRDRWGLAEPVIIPYRGEREGQEPRSHSVDEPLPTMTTERGHALVQPTAQPWLQPHWNERPGQAPRLHSINEPVPAVTSRGAGSLVEPVLIQTDQTGSNGTCVRSVDTPLPTQHTKRNLGLTMPALVEPTLVQLQPGMRVDPRRLVMIDGILNVLDIRYRMLKNPELARAMGFEDAESRYEFTGSQTEITKQIGNAVCVSLAAALVTAALYDAAPELAAEVA